MKTSNINSKFILVLLCLLTSGMFTGTSQLFSQVPNEINYQAVVRDNAGSPQANTLVSFRFEIFSGSLGGPSQYMETHNLSTDNFGLVNLQIGSGGTISGNFSTIPWDSSDHVLEIQFDPAGGSSFSTIGTTRFLSVPYAKVANIALQDAVDDADHDPINELDGLYLQNDTLQARPGSNSGVDLSLYLDNTDNQTLILNGDTLTISGGNSVSLSTLFQSALPVGMIIPFGGDTALLPPGWLLCDGSTVDRSTYQRLFNVIGEGWGAGDSTTTFHLPDLCGSFLRGVDLGRGRDPNANSRYSYYPGGNTTDQVGSYQEDEFESHVHWGVPWLSSGLTFYGGGGVHFYSPWRIDSGSHHTAPAGGDETRPKNAYVHFIIKY